MLAGSSPSCEDLLSVVSEVSPMILWIREELKFVVTACAAVVAIREVKVTATVIKHSILTIVSQEEVAGVFEGLLRGKWMIDG